MLEGELIGDIGLKACMEAVPAADLSQYHWWDLMQRFVLV